MPETFPTGGIKYLKSIGGVVLKTMYYKMVDSPENV